MIFYVAAAQSKSEGYDPDTLACRRSSSFALASSANDKATKRENILLVSQSHNLKTENLFALTKTSTNPFLYKQRHLPLTMTFQHNVSTKNEPREDTQKTRVVTLKWRCTYCLHRDAKTSSTTCSCLDSLCSGFMPKLKLRTMA
jgi:hypothetical protein